MNQAASSESSTSVTTDLVCIEPLKTLIQSVNHWIIGLDDTLMMMMVALLCGGHVLIEGPPGTAKTLMVKLLSEAIQVDFKRIQFTPDLMPADLIGTNVFNPQNQTFAFHQGPLFTTFLLADEINRAPAKTQSALLESMQELQITVEGTSYPLSELFTVFATQNPLEHEGTYPLPEAQLDRFLFKLLIPYPSKSVGLHILEQHHQQRPGAQDVHIQPVLKADEVIALRQKANEIVLQPELMAYLMELIEQTRLSPHVAVGASPRSSILWLKAAKALAFVEGRDYVIPDDIKRVAKPLLRHRLILFPQAELEGRTTDEVIEGLLMAVQPPR